jgi:hypothetical protein
MELSLTIPKGMKQITIDSMPPTEFHGKLLGVVDNDRHGRPRWAELELYRYVDTDPEHVRYIDDGGLYNDPPIVDEANSTYGKEMYLLHTMGHSVVYHRADSECNKGITIPVEQFAKRAEFPDDLEPCPECRPPAFADLDDDEELALEILRHLIHSCRNADSVLERLKRPSKMTCPQCNGHRSFPEFTRQVCDKCRGRGFVGGPLQLTAPGARLIEIVKWKDEDIMRAVTRTVRL